jgi:putative hemolysin
MILLLLCLVFSAFFSASETALMSLNKIKVRQLLDEGRPHASLILRMLEDPQRLLSAILVGNNVVNIAAAALATSIAIRLAGNAGVGIATGIMTLLVLIFAEITPKSLAAAHAEKVALFVARPINGLACLLRPLVFVLTGITRSLLRLFGTTEIRQQNVTEDELRTMMDVSHEEGVIEQKERRLLENVFVFGDAQVSDIMIARTDITAIEVSATYDEIRAAFYDERVSRIPVYEDQIDNTIGILHIKDFFLYDQEISDFDLRQHLRKPFYTIEGKRVADLFEEMRTRRQQMAIVVDEYGGTAGIVTMQDIMGVIFGDIDDEYDHVNDVLNQISENEFQVEGSIRLKDLNELMHVHLNSDDFETIGGLITGELGRLPRQGDRLAVDGLQCQVLELDRNRITLLNISKVLDRQAPEH